jgi:inner membrane protein
MKTHVAFAALFALIALKYVAVSHQILFFLLVLFGALLPDIDHPKSTIGKYFKIIGKLFKHRGIFHSLFALPLITLLVYWLFDTTRFTFPLLLGYTSHLIGDMLSKEGIKPFTPLSNWTWRGGVFRVGSPTEFIILGLLLALDGYLLLHT